MRLMISSFVFRVGMFKFGAMSALNCFWDKLNRMMLFLLFLAGMVAVFFWYLPLIQQNQKYRRDIMRLDSEIQSEERLARELRTRITAVQQDPRTLERLARERLGLARTNEVVIHFRSGGR